MSTKFRKFFDNFWKSLVQNDLRITISRRSRKLDQMQNAECGLRNDFRSHKSEVKVSDDLAISHLLPL